MSESETEIGVGMALDKGGHAKYLRRVSQEVADIEEGGFKIIPKPDGKGFMFVRRLKGKIVILDRTIYGIIKKEVKDTKIFFGDDGSVIINGKEL